jgi:hypothetical protein
MLFNIGLFVLFSDSIGIVIRDSERNLILIIL